MGYGIKIYTSDGLTVFDNQTTIGWRTYESFAVGEVESGSKDYTGIIPAGHTIEAIVMPTGVVSGGSHSVSVSGYVVSWTYFTIPYFTGYENNPSIITVFFR